MIPALAAVLAVGVSCTRSENQSQTGPGGVDLGIRSWKETQALVAAHTGKIVVLDLWSTQCVPCLRELPGLVKLHRERGADGAVCISVSCDYAGIKDEPPEALREKVLAVLRKLGATFENVLLNVAAEDLFNEIGLGSIPAVFVYGRDGKLVKRFDNDAGLYGEDGFRYETHVVPLVSELLGRR